MGIYFHRSRKLLREASAMKQSKLIQIGSHPLGIPPVEECFLAGLPLLVDEVLARYYVLSGPAQPGRLRKRASSLDRKASSLHRVA